MKVPLCNENLRSSEQATHVIFPIITHHYGGGMLACETTECYDFYILQRHYAERETIALCGLTPITDAEYAWKTGSAHQHQNFELVPRVRRIIRTKIKSRLFCVNASFQRLKLVASEITGEPSIIVRENMNDSSQGELRADWPIFYGIAIVTYY